MAGPFNYNPGNQNVSGQLMAQGIQQGLAKIGQGVKDYRQKQADKEAEDAAVRFAIEKGWVKDEGEAKAAVKALGGGRNALPFIAQMQQMEQQQQQQAAAAQAAAAQRAQEEAAIRAALQPQMVPYGQGRGVLRNPTTPPTPEQAVAAYMNAGGRSSETATMLGKLPNAPASNVTELNFVEDPVTGARFAIGDKGNFASSGINPAKGAPKTPSMASAQGKLLADADVLEASGRTNEAQLLRDSAKRYGQPRLSSTQIMELQSTERRLDAKLAEVAQIDEQINQGAPGLFTTVKGLQKDRDRLIKEAATLEDSLDRIRQMATDPLGDSSTGDEPVTREEAAPRKTDSQTEKLYVVQNDQLTISPDLPPKKFMQALQQAVDDLVLDPDEARRILKERGFKPKG